MKSGQITVTHEGLTSHYVRVHWSLVGISGLVATIVVTLVLFSSVPSATWSPLEGMKESTKSKIQQTVPQGWAFSPEVRASHLLCLLTHKDIL